jgi:hypothetical protein
MKTERIPINKATIVTLIDEAKDKIEYYSLKVRIYKLNGGTLTNNMTHQLSEWNKKLEKFKEIQKNL